MVTIDVKSDEKASKQKKIPIVAVNKSNQPAAVK